MRWRGPPRKSQLPPCSAIQSRPETHFGPRKLACFQTPNSRCHRQHQIVRGRDTSTSRSSPELADSKLVLSSSFHFVFSLGRVYSYFSGSQVVHSDWLSFLHFPYWGAVYLNAQESGQIEETVLIKETGDPLHGAHILVVELGLAHAGLGDRSTIQDGPLESPLFDPPGSA